jgi:hypothetical protein
MKLRQTKSLLKFDAGIIATGLDVAEFAYQFVAGRKKVLDLSPLCRQAKTRLALPFG